MNRIVVLWLFFAAIATGVAYSQNVYGIDMPTEMMYIMQKSETKDGFYAVGDVNRKMAHKTIYLECYVSDVREKDGNVFFDVTDKRHWKHLNAVMLKKANEEKPDRKKLLKKAHKEKTPVFLEGEIDISNDDLEIITWKVWEDS